MSNVIVLDDDNDDSIQTKWTSSTKIVSQKCSSGEHEGHAVEEQKNGKE